MAQLPQGVWNLPGPEIKPRLGFSGGASGKEPACRVQEMQETRVPSLGQEDPLGRKWQPTPVFLPGNSHRQWILVGCGP